MADRYNILGAAPVLISDTPATGEVLVATGTAGANWATFASNFPVVDETTIVNKTGDTSANMRIDADAVATATTRVLTMPNSDVDLTANSGTFAAATHASRHITGGADEIDGDQLDIDFTPSNYTPSTAPAEATNLDHLTAHLSGIDTALGAASGLPVVDGTSIAEGSVDNTKEVRFELDTNVTTGTVRVITVADEDIDMTPDTGAYPATDGGTRLTGTADTANATPTTIATYTTTTNNSAYVFKFTVWATEAATGETNGAMFEMTGRFHRDNSGTVTEKTLTFVNGPDRDVAAWDVSANISTSDIQFQVTGEAATDIDWQFEGRAYELTGTP